MAITLPTEASAPNKRWKNQKFIMLGDSKIGKTSFWAQGPNTLFIRTEQGHSHLKHIGVDCTDWNDFTEIRGQLIQLHKTDKFPYDTIVIDTGDRFLEIMADEVTDRGREKFPNNEIYGIGDIPNGQGWMNQTKLMNITLRQLEELPAAIVLIFHVATEELEEKGRKYQKDTINVTGKGTRKAILAWPDHTLHVRSHFYGDTLARVLVTRGNKHVQAGSRLASLPPQMQWTEDDAKNYSEFRKHFDE